MTGSLVECLIKEKKEGRLGDDMMKRKEMDACVYVCKFVTLTVYPGY